ncbi:unnamed protein product [Rhodiola kirilowii]
MNNMAAARSIQHQMGSGGGGGGGGHHPHSGMPINHHQMGNFQAVQGLPAPPGNSHASGGGPAYFQGGANPDIMAASNPYQQQQLAAAMMNQQRSMGNERFQPMIYARPPPAVNYMPVPASPHYSAYPQYPYPYPYPPPLQSSSSAGGHYDEFSDENTSGCNVM